MRSRFILLVRHAATWAGRPLGRAVMHRVQARVETAIGPAHAATLQRLDRLDAAQDRIAASMDRIVAMLGHVTPATDRIEAAQSRLEASLALAVQRLGRDAQATASRLEGVEDAAERQAVQLQALEAAIVDGARHLLHRHAIPLGDYVAANSPAWYILVPVSDPAALIALATGQPAQPGVTLVLESLVDPGDQVIEWSARTAEATLTLARRVGPGGRVWVNAASPDAAEGIRRTLAVHGLEGRVTMGTPTGQPVAVLHVGSAAAGPVPELLGLIRDNPDLVAVLRAWGPLAGELMAAGLDHMMRLDSETGACRPVNAASPGAEPPGAFLLCRAAAPRLARLLAPPG